ncbi:MAG: hypothetical protein GF409_04900 [Candidatus Omnitrophica bacterium]|nr:hypothetical protein [Candidatus Omnitrophota bacterium]
MDIKRTVPVIINGAKRSGNTLLQYLLDSVPGVFTFLDECYFLEYLYDIGEENIQSFVEIQKTANVKDLFESTRKRSLFHFYEQGYSPKGTVNTQHINVEYDLDKLISTLDEMQKKMDDNVLSVWEYWVSAVMRSMGQRIDNKDFTVFKCPDYGKSMLSAIKYLNDPKVIVMVRDPLYAIDSLKRSREIRNEKRLYLFELFNVINNYKFLLETLNNINESKSKDRVMVIRYEDLTRNPLSVMQNLAGFTGIPFHPNMLEATLNGEKWYGESSFSKFNGISTESTTRDIRALNAWERGYITDQLKDFNGYFGYE